MEIGRLLLFQSFLRKYFFRKKNFRNGALFALFSFFNTGINFLVMMVMAKFIQPDSYGQLSLFTTMVSLLSILICLNTNGFIGTNFFTSSKERIRRLLNVVLLTTLFVYIVVLTYVNTFTSAFEQISGITVTFQFYAISFCLLNVINSLLLDIWRLEEKVLKYGAFSILSVMSNLALTILFVGFLKWDWHGRVYAQLLTCVCFAIIAIYILIKKGYLCKILPQKTDFLEAYKFGIPLIPHATSFWLRQGLDRYVINAFTTQAIVGLFSFAVNFANIIQIVGMAFNSSNSVYIYKTLADLDTVKLCRLKKDCLLLVLFYVSLTMLIVIGAYLFVPLVFPKYEECIKYIFPLCVGSMFQCFYLVYVNIIFFYRKTTQLMYITFSLSFLHSALSFALTRYGVIYTAYISIVINMLIAGCIYWYSQKLLKNV